MKALFTYALVPAALFGAGVLAAVAFGLVRAGWGIGARVLKIVFAFRFASRQAEGSERFDGPKTKPNMKGTTV